MTSSADQTAARRAAANSELEAVIRERDILRKALEAREAGRDDAQAAVRQVQDLRAEIRRLQDALAAARMRGDELDARCADLQRESGELALQKDESQRQLLAARAELIEIRKTFEQRVAQLAQAMDTLRSAPTSPERHEGS